MRIALERWREGIVRTEWSVWVEARIHVQVRTGGEGAHVQRGRDRDRGGGGAGAERIWKMGAQRPQAIANAPPHARGQVRGNGGEAGVVVDAGCRCGCCSPDVRVLITCVAHLCRWVSACPSNDPVGALTPLVRRSDPSARPEACQPFSPSAPPRQPTPPGGGGPCSAQTRCSTRLLSSARARSRTRPRKQRRARAHLSLDIDGGVLVGNHQGGRCPRPPPLSPLFPRKPPPPPSPLPPSRPRALLCPGYSSAPPALKQGAPPPRAQSAHEQTHSGSARVPSTPGARARVARAQGPFDWRQRRRAPAAGGAYPAVAPRVFARELVPPQTHVFRGEAW